MSYKRLTKYNEYCRNAEVYAYTVGNKDVYFDGIDIVGNENSSLAQETIDKLAELEDKIENGTLIELPCKVGDKVFCIYRFYDVEEGFEYDIIPEEVVDIIVMEDDFDIGTACRMIGKFQRVCVCLTKAEAEKKLKELQGND